jgi:mannan polymerase II complex MNN11 subunit
MLWNISCSRPHLLNEEPLTGLLMDTNRWHGTLLAKIALIPQSLMNSYTDKDAHLASGKGLWNEGDFMVSFPDCDSAGRSCKNEMDLWFKVAEKHKES